MKIKFIPLLILIGSILISGTLLIKDISYELPNSGISQNIDKIVYDVNPEKDLIRGNPNAPYFIIEYVDFQCPFCKELHKDLKFLLQHPLFLDGDVAWVLRDSPILDNVSLKKASTVKCVRDTYGDDLAWLFIDDYIQITQENNFDRERIYVIIENLNKDSGKIVRCIESNLNQKYAQNAKNIASFSLNINETPYIQIVNNQNDLIQDFSRDIIGLGYEGLVSVLKIILESS